MPIEPLEPDAGFFFNDTATTEIYTLSLHDALPIFESNVHFPTDSALLGDGIRVLSRSLKRIATQCKRGDRKSTRLNSSHSQISYAVFCLKKKDEFVAPEADSSLLDLLGDSVALSPS